jgi:hypothetical protein
MRTKLMMAAAVVLAIGTWANTMPVAAQTAVRIQTRGYLESSGLLPPYNYRYRYGYGYRYGEDGPGAYALATPFFGWGRHYRYYRRY